ncbi:MAG: DUF4291 domain-containing protein [Planctomycetaceae bacterium]|nr:DUF4291 domain-containing protein [Planctomycetaceae bacterium]MCB9951221.1 DUF4291 domain-containing protein [Planctomycetaceae bacterium]
MLLNTEPFVVQSERWPKSGRVILAQSDSESVVVYQAYRPSIGHFAAKHGYFGGDFSMSRMTWIKPNFLWMMYRSGWGTKEGQEVTLAIRLARNAFDEILRQAVHSTFNRQVYSSHEGWKQAVANSNVRLQWDPDHGPSGAPLERRAIQLGLRGPVVEKYVRDWVLDIEDISEFVEQQRHAATAGKLDQLVTPSEATYAVTDSAVAGRLELDHGGG